MKKIILSLLSILLCQSLFAQNLQERIYAFLDKDIYVTGEQVLVKVQVTDSQGNPSPFSRVAYVELCDTHSLQAKCMVQLTGGEGWATMDLPNSMHSGNYLLSAYTRDMRNVSREKYARQLVPVVNLLHTSPNDDLEWMEAKDDEVKSSPIFTDKNKYSTRSKVVFTLPVEAKDSKFLSLSVSRKDLTIKSDILLPALAGRKSQKTFLPELEGHMVQARSVDSTAISNNSMLAIVGRNATIFEGQLQDDGTTLYYTSGLNGTLPVVLSRMWGEHLDSRMEISSPFEEVFPISLPPLRLSYSSQSLAERNVSVQVEQNVRSLVPHEAQKFNLQLKSTDPEYFYDLDEWRRFKTVREILIEFVKGVSRRKINGKNMLFTTSSSSRQNWPALVLLDGAPITDADKLLEYDATKLKYLVIYTNLYTFGHNIWNGVISFVSKRATLSDILLPEDSQMFTYSFPQERPAFLSPVYEGEEALSSVKPDFRHTLYWNPSVCGTCEFYTSDLKGTYLVRLQGVDANGAVQTWNSEFTVE